MKKEHISFSEIYSFHTCPQKHYLSYIEKVDTPNTIYTVFGTAIHEAIDKKDSSIISEPLIDFIKQNPIDEWAGKLDAKEWIEKALRIYTEFSVWLESEFPGFTLVASEEALLEPLEGRKMKFKGFVDYIIKDKDGKYHILDFKTVGNFWFGRFIPDSYKMYQVILYKHFYCQKHNKDPNNVMCHYVQMRRKQSKKGGNIKLHSITSGPKKVKNALKWLDNIVGKMEMGVKMSNPSTCSFCICGDKK